MDTNEKTIIVVDIMLMKENKILLYLKKRDDALELPGGYVISGKDMYESIIEHLQNQTNLTVNKNDLEIVHLMHYPAGKKLYVIIKSTKFEGELLNLQPLNFTNLGWYDYENLPDKLHKKLKKSFNEVKEGVFYSEYVKK